MAFIAYEAQCATRRQRNATVREPFGKPCAGKSHARFERGPYRNSNQGRRKVGSTNVRRVAHGVSHDARRQHGKPARVWFRAVRCVSSYVSRVREVAVLRAIRAEGPAAAIESGLDEIFSQMTAVEREFVGAWRDREQALAPAQAHLQRLPVEESPDPRLHTARQSAAA